jgi:hypothetical protein
MKTITFNYRKSDGSISERTLLALITPGNKYAGIDISSLPPELGAEFVNRYEQLHIDFLAEVKELQAEYDVKHNYRQFNEEGMSDIIEI